MFSLLCECFTSASDASVALDGECGIVRVALPPYLVFAEAARCCGEAASPFIPRKADGIVCSRSHANDKLSCRPEKRDKERICPAQLPSLSEWSQGPLATARKPYKTRARGGAGAKSLMTSIAQVRSPGHTTNIQRKVRRQGQPRLVNKGSRCEFPLRLSRFNGFTHLGEHGTSNHYYILENAVRWQTVLHLPCRQRERNGSDARNCKLYCIGSSLLMICGG